MDTLKAILEYIAIGVTVVFLVDLLAYMTTTSSPITNRERILLVVLWPLTILSFIRSVFKNLKK
jgi:hypothetical protein